MSILGFVETHLPERADAFSWIEKQFEVSGTRATQILGFLQGISFIRDEGALSARDLYWNLRSGAVGISEGFSDEEIEAALEASHRSLSGFCGGRRACTPRLAPKRRSLGSCGS